MSAAVETVNPFDVLSIESVVFSPSVKRVSIPKHTVAFKKPETVIPDLQSQYPLTMITFSGFTNNEFVISKTKISSALKLKKNASALELNEIINNMGLPYYCLIWCTSIDTPELNKLIENQYPLPSEYQDLYKLMCDDKIVNKKCQNVLVLDFRRKHIRGREYVYLLNHQQFFFGRTRESYLTRKSEVFGLKKYYDIFCQNFNFDELDKIILECHQYALTGADTEWINFRENLIHLFRDAASVFSMTDAKVFERFSNFENLKKEAEMVKLYMKEFFEMLPKMKKDYDRKMFAMDVHNNRDEMFPSL